MIREIFWQIYKNNILEQEMFSEGKPFDNLMCKCTVYTYTILHALSRFVRKYLIVFSYCYYWLDLQQVLCWFVWPNKYCLCWHRPPPTPRTSVQSWQTIYCKNISTNCRKDLCRNRENYKTLTVSSEKQFHLYPCSIFCRCH